MKIIPVMITCEARKPIFTECLASWRATDWGVDPHVLVDNLNLPDKRKSGNEYARRAFQWGLEQDPDYLLFLEDDVEFNKYLRHNLETWDVLRRGEIWATVYSTNPDMRGRDGVRPGLLFAGFQAVLLHRAVLPHLLGKWEWSSGFGGGHDLIAARVLTQVAPAIWVHSPCLVQHKNPPSTMGNGGHTSPFFDPTWKRTVYGFIPTIAK